MSECSRPWSKLSCGVVSSHFDTAWQQHFQIWLLQGLHVVPFLFSVFFSFIPHLLFSSILCTCDTVPFGQGLIATFSRSRSARLGEAELPLVMQHLSKQSDCQCVCVCACVILCVWVCAWREKCTVALEALKSIQDAHLSMVRALLLFIFSLWFTCRYVVVLLLQSCVLQANLLCRWTYFSMEKKSKEGASLFRDCMISTTTLVACASSSHCVLVLLVLTIYASVVLYTLHWGLHSIVRTIDRDMQWISLSGTRHACVFIYRINLDITLMKCACPLMCFFFVLSFFTCGNILM